MDEDLLIGHNPPSNGLDDFIWAGSIHNKKIAFIREGNMISIGLIFAGLFIIPIPVNYDPCTKHFYRSPIDIFLVNDACSIQ
jgi:hypothetical protein